MTQEKLTACDDCYHSYGYTDCTHGSKIASLFNPRSGKYERVVNPNDCHEQAIKGYNTDGHCPNFSEKAGVA